MLTIAPTISCNFACTYCFQEHPQRTMDSEQVTRTKRFIEARLQHGTHLHVTWFGGEPLMAFPVIQSLLPWMEELAAARRDHYTGEKFTNCLM